MHVGFHVFPHGATRDATPTPLQSQVGVAAGWCVGRPPSTPPAAAAAAPALRPGKGPGEVVTDKHAAGKCRPAACNFDSGRLDNGGSGSGSGCKVSGVGELAR